ncbi:MAG: ATP-binding protein [Gammaproteobacteria bacterium]
MVTPSSQRRAGDGADVSPLNGQNQILDYADLYEHAPAGYLLLSASARIEKINCTGARLLGWNQSWLLDKPFSRWVVDTDKQLFHAHYHRLRLCEECISQELRVKNRQGRIVNIRLLSVREAGHPGTMHFRSIMIDVSREQEYAHKLRNLQSQLAHASRLNTVGELASSLAHELNQPLGTVVLNCEAAQRLLNSGASQEYEFAEALLQAREAASFASEVVRHLRGFLRNGNECLSDCELTTLFQDVSPLIEADASDNGIELQFEIEPDLPPVHVDSVQIEQVLLNLVHNSIEAMRENGGSPRRVLVRAYREAPNRVQVSVADTGPGLDSKQLDCIFKPFYTTKNSGMGMGLTISRTIIEAHGGQLWAVAEPGHGAIFHFTLPTTDRECHLD